MIRLKPHAAPAGGAARLGKGGKMKRSTGTRKDREYTPKAAPVGTPEELRAASIRAARPQETLADGWIDGPADDFLAAHAAPEPEPEWEPNPHIESALWTIATRGAVTVLPVSVAAMRHSGRARSGLVSEAHRHIQATAAAARIPLQVKLRPGAGKRPAALVLSPVWVERPTVGYPLGSTRGNTAPPYAAPIERPVAAVVTPKRPRKRVVNGPVLIWGRNGGRAVALAAAALAAAPHGPARWAALRLAALSTV